MTKYTFEVLSSAAQQSYSIAGVLRILGLKQAGGTQAHIGKRLKQLGVDTSHFTGQAYQKGQPCNSHNKKSINEILVRLPEGSLRPRLSQLRRALTEMGVLPECNSCKLAPYWNGSYLQLEIDHIDNDWLNNQLQNLRYLCPNCHSQK